MIKRKFVMALFFGAFAATAGLAAANDVQYSESDNWMDHVRAEADNRAAVGAGAPESIRQRDARPETGARATGRSARGAGNMLYAPVTDNANTSANPNTGGDSPRGGDSGRGQAAGY